MTGQPLAKLRAANKKRLGLVGYCRILRSILLEPGTGEALALRLGVNRNTLNHVLRSLHRMGLIHRSAWIKPKAHSVAVAVWSFGCDGDVAPLVGRPATRKARNVAITLGTISEILREAPASMTDLAGEMGVHRETAIRYIRILRKHGLARIGAWDRRDAGGAPIALYAFGPGINAKRPKALGVSPERAKEHSARHYAKKKHMAMVQAMAGRLAA